MKTIYLLPKYGYGVILIFLRLDEHIDVLVASRVLCHIPTAEAHSCRFPVGTRTLELVYLQRVAVAVYLEWCIQRILVGLRLTVYLLALPQCGCGLCTWRQASDIVSNMRML